VHGTLDPLTRDLIVFEDEQDLRRKVDFIYRELDEDESGGLTFEVRERVEASRLRFALI
jgi:hypothetical protein